MGILSDKKIDSHCHVLDPARFPYHLDVSYRPAGQEMGNADYFIELMDCYAVHHALLVGPNSGYATDNACLLDAIAQGNGRFKGIAVVPNDCSDTQLNVLQSQGVIGIAFNPSLMGFDFYANLEPLLKRLKNRNMWAQFQVEKDLLLPFLPMINRVGGKILIDHCGRPNLDQGTEQAGFQSLLALGREGRAVVKISGYAKFSQMAYPFAGVQPFVDALVKNFGTHNCVWASDWPYLKAPYRLDYGPMLKVFENQFSVQERTTMLWDAPMHHFQFA
jgi:predicted TIM-barrel fold metal-dependent hydrolase